MAAPSVAVIGGGVIGCATAADLAKRGCRVALFGDKPASITPFLPGRFLS